LPPIAGGRRRSCSDFFGGELDRASHFALHHQLSGFNSELGIGPHVDDHAGIDRQDRGALNGNCSTHHIRAGRGGPPGGGRNGSGNGGLRPGRSRARQCNTNCKNKCSRAALQFAKRAAKRRARRNQEDLEQNPIALEGISRRITAARIWNRHIDSDAATQRCACNGLSLKLSSLFNTY